MKLSDLFGQGEQNIPKGTTDKTTANDPKQNYRLQQQIKALKPGQTLQGEVVGKNGSEVYIKISDDLVLTARMDKDLPVEIGKLLTFEVKGGGGKTLTLSPLFENMGTDANVLKALDMAGLPMNKTTISMAEGMMAEGLSIDRNSLIHMFKSVINNPDAPLQNMLVLNRLGVEISPENLQQLENYQNLEHQIIKDTTHIIDELSLQFKAFIQSGDKESAMKLYTGVLDLITNQGILGSHSLDATEITNPMEMNEIPKTEDGQVSELAKQVDPQSKQTQMVELIGKDYVLHTENEDFRINGGMDREVSFQEQSTNTTSTNPMKESVLPLSEALNLRSSQPIVAILSETQLQNLSMQLQEMGIEESVISSVRNGTIEVSTLMKLLAQFVASNEMGVGQESIGKLYAGKEFQTLLKAELAAQWTISPKDGLQKKNIESLYQRLKNQLSSLEDTINQVKNSETSLSKSVSNLKNNLEFMQQLNQTFTYIQLPLKMHGGNAHGDLYVYTNKKSLAKKDGKVSALLHLDMENLGPVDIYVAMENKKVNTHFYLKDDQMLSFIENNIHILNERLEKRGYSMNCEMSIKEGSKNVIDEMLTAEKSVAKISQYSFDVRA